METKSNNYGLSEALKRYKENSSNNSSSNFQIELWGAWKYNHKMYVPVLRGYRNPYDWGMISSNSGSSGYVIYTEERLVEKWNGEPVVEGSYIEEIPFKEIIERLRMLQGKVLRTEVIDGLAINPIMTPPYDSPYSLGLTTDILLKICSGNLK